MIRTELLGRRIYIPFHKGVKHKTVIFQNPVFFLNISGACFHTLHLQIILSNKTDVSLMKALAYTKGLNCRVKYGTEDRVFKNAPSKICGRQPLKNLKLKQTISNLT